jgi:hypothetical protein
VTKPPASTVRELARFYRRNGYVRLLDSERRRKENQLYKKGDEVRLVADTASELAAIRGLLARAGFKLARPFVKGRQYRQPVYGREEVARFLAMVARQPKNRPRTRVRRPRKAR